MNTLELRPYQVDCVNIINSKNEGRYLVSLATGLGKTVIFSHIQRKGRTLILSHRDELVRQPEKYFEGCSFGVEKADEHANNEEIISASVQTLSKENRLTAFSPDEFYTIIIDEAHHAAAPSYRKIIKYFSGAKLIIGVTATPKRGDHVRLTDVFDEIIFDRDLKWGIQNGYLSPIRCEMVKAEYSLQNIRKVAGDYNQKSLSKTMSSLKVISTAAKTYFEECHNKERHTLIYCVSKSACTIMKNTIDGLLPENEQNTVCVLTGDTPDDERKQMLSGFSQGKIKCIINCMVLTEGTDLPICDTIMNLRPTCNSSLYQQIIGRGTRLYDNKEYCLVIDIIPNDSNKLRDFCTAPTLFGIDPANMSQKLYNSLNQNIDLLEFCQKVAVSCVDMAQEMELTVKMWDAFADELNNIITTHSSGLKEMAIAYKEYLSQKKDSEFNELFGNLDVEISPDVNHYFVIHPTYYDSITISKPDMLDSVTIDFNIDSKYIGMSGRKRFIGDMKFHDAIALAKQYCELMPPEYQYSWNLDLQNRWGASPITENQIRRIQTDYKQYNVNYDDMKQLTKLDASRLIDLQSASVLTKKKADFYQTEKADKKIQKSKLVLFEKEKKKEEEQIRIGRNHFEEFAKRVQSHTQFQKEINAKIQDAIDKKMDEVRNGTFITSIKITTVSKQPISEAQLAAYNGLSKRLRKQGFIIDPQLKISRLTKGQASIVISLLKNIEQTHLQSTDCVYMFTKNSLFGAFKKAELCRTGTKSFSFQVIPK